MAEQTKAVAKVVTSEELIAYTSKFLKSSGGEVKLPPNYDAVGAVKAFHLALLDVKDKNNMPALEVCSKASIFKAALELVTKGLDIRKKQAYPVVYGNQLVLQVGYFGNQKQAKTYRPELGDFHAQIILKGDQYETAIEPDGRKVLVKHKQPSLADRSIENIIGAYSIVKVCDDQEGKPIYDLEDMTIAQIKQSWAKSKTGGTTHKEFSEEMCKKTVISRHAKRLINTTDDSAIFEGQKPVVSGKPVSIDDDKDENIPPDVFVDADYSVDEETGEVIPEPKKFDDDKGEEKKADNTEWTPEEEEEVINQEQKNYAYTVRYSDWSNTYKPTGEWEIIQSTYNPAEKTVQIRRKAQQ